MSERFTNHDRIRLQQALLEAFDDIDELERLTAFGFDQSLNTIVVVHGRNITKIVADLIRWAESQPNGIHRLVDAARKRRPDDFELRSIADDWSDIEFAVRLPPQVTKRYRTLAKVGAALLLAAVTLIIIIGLQGPLREVGRDIQARFPPTPVSSGEFGIAVADFGLLESDGSVRERSDLDASEDIFKRLEPIYHEIAEATGSKTAPDIRHSSDHSTEPFRPTLMSGKDEAERADRARSLAEQIKPNLIIYGEIDGNDEAGELALKFHLSEKLLGDLPYDYLQFFTGPHGLGRPFSVDHTSQRKTEEFNRSIDRRLRTLMWLTRAVTDASSEPQAALAILEKAELNLEESGADLANEPMELIHLLRGFIQVEARDHEKSEQSFMQALEIRSDLPRALIGLGSVHFIRAHPTDEGSSPVEGQLSEMNDAIARYEEAVELASDSRYELYHANLALGVGLTQRGMDRFCREGEIAGHDHELIEDDLVLGATLLEPLMKGAEEVSDSYILDGYVVEAYRTLGLNAEIHGALIYPSQEARRFQEMARDYYQGCIRNAVDNIDQGSQEQCRQFRDEVIEILDGNATPSRPLICRGSTAQRIGNQSQAFNGAENTQ